MADWAYTNYVIEGPKETLKIIHDAIQATKVSDEGNKWEVDVLNTLGLDWEKYKEKIQHFDLRGSIFPDTIELDETLSFDAEEAYGISDLKDVLKGEYPNLKIYYNVEESNEEVYATNDTEGKYFPYRVFVDTCIDGDYQSEYFIYKSDVFKWLHNITDGRINTEEKVEEFNENCDEDDYIYIHEFAIIEDEVD